MSTPKFRFYMAASADGFLARTDGSVDWLDPFTDGYGYEEFIAGISTLVMGRVTYEQVLSFGVEWPYAGQRVIVVCSTIPDPADFVPARGSVDGDPAADATSAPPASHPDGVEFHHDGVAALIDKLRAEVAVGDGATGTGAGDVGRQEPPRENVAAIESRRMRGDVWVVGGPVLQRAFLELNALDSMELFVMPVLLGEGKPIIAPGYSTTFPLRLVDSTPYPDGVVRLLYERGD